MARSFEIRSDSLRFQYLRNDSLRSSVYRYDNDGPAVSQPRDPINPAILIAETTETPRFENDPESWAALYRELGERVFRLLHRMTGDEEAARDLLHDTFVVAIGRISQYSGRGSVSSWIFSIAVNLAKERGRSAARRSTVTYESSPEAEGLVPDESTKVVTHVLLERALQGLPEEYRTTLLLHEVDGYTHAEIAEMMGIAEGSSRARLARTKAQLRQLLKGKI